jgi:NAD(P)H-dependent flavin oxidoreductase YrpB (nitropropane dioxygenase family)
MGTAFLGSVEAAPGRVLLSKLIAAGSSDTVVSRSVSGKTLRMLRSAWSDEWAAADAPEPLKMPYQDILIGDMLGQILRHEVEPLVHEGAGQGVVHLTVQEPVADIMERLVREADEVLAKLGG